MLSVIATDLDGTFLTDHDHVSQTNLAAVAAASEAGIPFVFATGRPIRWLGFLTHVSGHPHAITGNGAAIVDLATQEVEVSWPIDPVTVVEVVADVRRTLPGAVFALEHGTRMGLEDSYPTWEEAAVIRGPLETLLDSGDPVLKLLIKHPEVDTDTLYATLAPVIGDRLTTTFSWLSPVGLLELSAPGVSKAHALAWLCAEHGFDRAGSVAFGDMPNDLDMLRWVGRGYVVPGAHPRLLACGLPVIDGDQTDAVGRTVLRLLAERAEPLDCRPHGGVSSAG